jgi:hypothetical protein
MNSKIMTSARNSTYWLIIDVSEVKLPGEAK